MIDHLFIAFFRPQLNVDLIYYTVRRTRFFVRSNVTQLGAFALVTGCYNCSSMNDHMNVQNVRDVRCNMDIDFEAVSELRI